MAQKVFDRWSDVKDSELQRLLDDGWRVIFATPYKVDYIHYILQKDTRKEKLDKLNEISK